MNDEGSPTWRLLSEQLEAAKGEISRLKALRNEGELNEKLKDPGYAAKVALAGLISERDELLLQVSELQNTVRRDKIAYDTLARSYEALLAKTEKRNCQIQVDDGPCGMLLPCPRHKRSREEECPACFGQGRVSTSDVGIQTCPLCDGKKKV